MSNNRLTQGNPTVIAGHLAVQQHSKAGRFQRGHGQRQQQPVLVTPPAEGHGAQSRVGGDVLAHLDGHLGYRLVTDDGREILLEKPDTIVGRSHPRDTVAPDIDLNALGLENARTASRRHCRLFIENGVCFLEDLGSMNGTRLNDARLEAGNLYRLSPEDLISAGQVLLTFRAPPQ